MFEGPDPEEIEDWVCVLEGSTEHEVAMAQNFLANMEIPSNILSKRDSAYSLNVGEMALVYLYVPKEYAAEAREALDELNDMDLPPGGEEE
ncbi:MAG: hypothetical protein U5K31_01235 [Balneolaceae bacterium]|nr:hypothetical protein [Balneolaceae bacterium]